jgi:peptidoglycan hydrolase CwlO-like protein
MKHLPVVAVFAVLMVFFVPHNASAQTIRCDTPQEKIQCQAALDQVNAELAQAQKDLATAQAKSSSLANDIAILAAKIKAAQLDIKAKNLLIQTLGNNITQKQSHIDDLEASITRGKETISTILRKTYEIDASSLPEVILSQSSVAGFFQDLDTFESVREGLKTTFEQLRSDQAATNAEKDALTVRKNKETDARYAIQQQQKSIESNQAEQKRLLALSKGDEKAYASLAADKAAKAAQIRAALFPLAGGQKIPFGQALQYATEASQKTGVRPAFILAVLTQESALGANVGNCYLSNVSTGDGIKVNTGQLTSKVMSPTRDVPIFIQITQKLGYDPMKTVVSCPQSVGWGGAMGPAQFIASTWTLLEDRISSALNLGGTPNPWNPEHAFMASGLFLSDLGASRGGYTAERNAACRYFSGSICSKSSLVASYGNSVVSKADTIQQTINQL